MKLRGVPRNGRFGQRDVLRGLHGCRYQPPAQLTILSQTEETQALAVHDLLLDAEHPPASMPNPSPSERKGVPIEEHVLGSLPGVAGAPRKLGRYRRARADNTRSGAREMRRNVHDACTEWAATSSRCRSYHAAPGAIYCSHFCTNTSGVSMLFPDTNLVRRVQDID